MAIIEGLIAPVAKLLDRIIPDPEARDRAKLELLKIENSQEMQQLQSQMTVIVVSLGA